MWGGDLYHEWSQTPALIAQLARFGRTGAATDPAAWLIVGFAHAAAEGFFASATPTHAQPQSAHPAVFDALFAIPCSEQ